MKYYKPCIECKINPATLPPVCPECVPKTKEESDRIYEKMGGKKFDSGKPRISLIPSEVITGLADVLTFGAGKYGDYNWTKGIEYTRLIDAIDRHHLKFKSGIDLDEESGKSHLLHMMANLSFLYWMQQHKPDFDDRWEKKDEA